MILALALKVPPKRIRHHVIRACTGLTDHWGNTWERDLGRWVEVTDKLGDVRPAACLTKAGRGTTLGDSVPVVQEAPSFWVA